METIEPTKEGEPDGLVPKDSPSSFISNTSVQTTCYLMKIRMSNWYGSVKITNEKGKICTLEHEIRSELEIMKEKQYDNSNNCIFGNEERL